MSTGISISSINRIKELAEEKRYAEALEILDTQNLDKSINPQFLRISGEIFRENKRYYDSRRILLKAHQMSPQGIRIIFELIQLYLELGYFTRAKVYYEQYKFYSTPEDTQRDYVEYIMRKAEGADAKELSVILIPILERMPEDKWNFEAVLLYDKLGRKDKALEECKYILENFRNSVYVEGIAKYIDNVLDVDSCLYIYPKEEQEEDVELFGDLIAEEDDILKNDYLMMYPPEARIMVEVEDKEAMDIKPAKEKKSRRRKKDNRNIETESEEFDMEAAVFKDLDNPNRELTDEEKFEQEKKEREAILEQLLSKRLDTDKIKESAKQAINAVKEIDREKAKNQVKSVAESVKDNVKKATEVIGEAVGAKAVIEEVKQGTESTETDFEAEQIVDGIIEDVIEKPKKVVGQVVTNEELDALIPDSLEAMSAEEIADLEHKREEAEQRELEALEAELQIAKNENLEEDAPSIEAIVEPEEIISDEALETTKSTQVIYESDSDSFYEELKAKFLEESEKSEDEQPLDSLGFITVVQSDVDQSMEEDIPEAANILHQMIDNKEFYADEDSNKFESKESYDDHDFEVENYDFDSFLKERKLSDLQQEHLKEDVQESLVVEEIYAEEQVVDFDEIIPSESANIESADETVEPFIYDEPIEEAVEEMIYDETEAIKESLYDDSALETSEETIYQEKDNSLLDESILVDSGQVISEESVLNGTEEVVLAESGYTEDKESVSEKAIYTMPEEPEIHHLDIDTSRMQYRNDLRIQIVISDRMVKKLSNLKESR